MNDIHILNTEIANFGEIAKVAKLHSVKIDYVDNGVFLRIPTDVNVSEVNKSLKACRYGFNRFGKERFCK